MKPHCGVHELHAVPLASFQNLLQLHQIELLPQLHQIELLPLGDRRPPPRVLPHGNRNIDGVHLQIVDYFVVAAAYLHRLWKLVGVGKLLGFFRGR
ncbi:hypothetical protein LINPERPRIM_LOCUS39768 [Linum perenne]